MPIDNNIEQPSKSPTQSPCADLLRVTDDLHNSTSKILAALDNTGTTGSNASAPTMSLTSFIECRGIRGRQAGRDQYATVWSLAMVQRLADESLTRALTNAEEPVDERFIADLADRFSAGVEPAFLQPILLGVLGPIEFLASETQPTLGTIRIDPANRIEILDGLHRLAALHRAAIPAERLAHLRLPVLITSITSPAELAQLRNMITCPAPVNSFERGRQRIDRAIEREIAKDSVSFSPFLTRTIDLNSITLALRSSRLFTLATYARACRPLLEVARSTSHQTAAEQHAAYWQHLGDLLPPWRRFAGKLITATELRERTVLANASLLGGLGLLGARLLAESPADWQTRVSPLADLDWQAGSPSWQGIIVTKGKRGRGNAAMQSAFRLFLNACELSDPPSEPGVMTAHGACNLESTKRRWK
jgi:hypothetical protein